MDDYGVKYIFMVKKLTGDSFGNKTISRNVLKLSTYEFNYFKNFPDSHQLLK